MRAGNIRSFKGNHHGRRDFIRNGSLFLAGLATLKTRAFALREEVKEIIPGTVPILREHPVTPPGSLSRERFNGICTACHLCISACPTQVLQPAYFSYGLRGMLQPRMDYLVSFCNFECTVCGEVCPTGALIALKTEEKKRVQLGKSYFVKENCVVFTRNTDCGACSEHCPTKAVKMIPYTGKLTIPEVTNDICVGCGACEYACPTDPKSIYVDGNPEHLVADPPPEEASIREVDHKKEFPF
jgi:ferredoxin